MSYDQELYVNENAVELEPLPEPETPHRAQKDGEYPPDLSQRERIATELLGQLTWSAEKGGYFFQCPGESLHTTLTVDRHTILYLDGSPTIKCQHNSCAKIVEAFTHQLRWLIAKAEYHAKPEARVAKLTAPDKQVSLAEWRSIIEANFPALVRPAETCLCVVAQLLLNDVSNPFALALVDVPSSGKTITLNFFDGPTELTYTTDNFTPASFVSHASNVKRDELGSVDLLPRIRYRTLIVRELGSILGAKDDDLIKSLGILTRVLDGEGLETDSGVHGRRGYKGDYLFMLLAGTTPIPPRVFKIMGNFGSRLFFLSLRTPDEDDEELIAQNKGTTRKLKESECKTTTERFLRTLWDTNPNGVTWNKACDPDDCLRVIARCSQIARRIAWSDQCLVQ